MIKGRKMKRLIVNVFIAICLLLPGLAQAGVTLSGVSLSDVESVQPPLVYSLTTSANVDVCPSDDCSYSFTRATTAPCTDYSNIVNQVQINEPCFTGARRVHNLVYAARSNDLTSWVTSGTASIVDAHTVYLPAEQDSIGPGGYTPSGGVEIGRVITFSASLSGTQDETATIVMWSSLGEGASKAVTLTPTSTRYSVSLTTTIAGAASFNGYIKKAPSQTADYVTVYEVQAEEITASEYVSTMPSDYADNLGPEELNGDGQSNAVSDNGTEGDALTGFGSAQISINGNTWESQSSIVSVGSYAFHAASNATPTAGARFYKDITTLSPTSGNPYKISFDIRHDGTGAEWGCYLSASSSGIETELVEVDSSDTSFESHEYYFIYNSDSKYFVCREWNTPSDGGIYLDNVSIKEIKPPAGPVGVQYFDTTNSCSVDSSTRLITGCGAGEPIPESGLKGFQSWDDGTNSVLQSREFNNTPWGTTGITITQDQVGIDGISNTAWTVEDDSATLLGGLSQSITVSTSSTTAVCSVYLKKDSENEDFRALRCMHSGSGTLQFQEYHFNTYTGECERRADTGTNDECGVIDAGNYWRLWGTSTDINDGNDVLQITVYPSISNTWDGVPEVAAIGSVVMDHIQVEENLSFPSPPIYTTTAAVTRNKDRLSFTATDNVSNTTGALFVDFEIPDVNTGINQSLVRSSAGQIIVNATGSVSLSDGTTWYLHNTDPQSYTPHKAGFSWSVGQAQNAYKDGVEDAEGGLFDGDMGFGSTFYVGQNSSNLHHLNGNLKNIKIFLKDLPVSFKERTTQ
jgi:hypothetical protein